MAYNSASKLLSEYLHVIRLQLCLGIAIIVISFGISHTLNVVISASLGFGLAIVPTLVYIKIAWSARVLTAEQILAKHKRAEVIKFFITVVGFVLIFSVYHQVQAFALFTAYLVTLSSYWISLLWQVKR